MPRLLLPSFAGAAGPVVDLPVWAVTPFVLLLLTIALLPLMAEKWWHHNRSKAIVAALLAVPTALYLAFVQWSTGQPALAALGHEMIKYVCFIFLLGSLYVVAGGIVVAGHMHGTPVNNTLFLAFGCVLANFIGTTGASVLLIRPVLRINQERKHTQHLPIFFIFMVSNLGGLLTPLGDPPLFLGFLNDVPFFWTLRLWREWLLVNGMVLAIFLVWDLWAFHRETVSWGRLSTGHDIGQSPCRLETGPTVGPALKVRGMLNLPFLAGIIAALLLPRLIVGPWGELIGAGGMAVMALLSLWLTPGTHRHANGFTWDPILEVAILFAGIFVTMVPALAILEANHDTIAVTEAWQFFWLTGGLSAFLDNAPTYLTFATMAAGSSDFRLLVQNRVAGIDGPLVLQAISCGAVFMGALTYIGNGPNFMVKAIADQAGYKTPSFFSFFGYSCLILVPIFIVVTCVFFVP